MAYPEGAIPLCGWNMRDWTLRGSLLSLGLALPCIYPILSTIKYKYHTNNHLAIPLRILGTAGRELRTGAGDTSFFRRVEPTARLLLQRRQHQFRRE